MGWDAEMYTKLFVPEDYDLKVLLGVLDSYIDLAQHNKYANNRGLLPIHLPDEPGGLP